MIFILKLLAGIGIFIGLRQLIKNQTQLPAIAPDAIAKILAGVYTLIYFAWNLTRYLGLATTMDLPVALQAFTNIALYSPILGKSLMAVHFSPVLFLFFPVFKILPWPLLLMALQAAALGAAVFPLYRIAQRLGLTTWPSLMIVFIYLNLSWTWNLAFADFRVEHLMPLALFWLFEFFLAGAGPAYWIILALCLGIKEDMGFYIFVWSIFAALSSKKLRVPALITALVSLGVGLAGLLVLARANQGSYPYFTHWSYLGNGLLGIIQGAILKPDLSAPAFWNAVFAKFLLSFALIPFFSYWGGALLAPLWIQLSSHMVAQSQLQMYYSAPVIPFVMVALAAGWKNCEVFFEDTPKRTMGLLALGIYLVVFNFSWPRPFMIDSQSLAAVRALKQLPDKGQILIQNDLAPHVSRIRRVRILGVNPTTPKTQWIVFNPQGYSWPFPRKLYQQVLEKMYLNTKFKFAGQKHGLIFFQRSAASAAAPAKPIVRKQSGNSSQTSSKKTPSPRKPASSTKK